jgi:nitrogen fixation/metabolism regulation signal transduction histidine kinase
MAATGSIRRRLALAIVLTALISMLVAIRLAETTVRKAADRFYTSEVGTWLDRSLGLYQELARTLKDSMRAEADALAARAPLRAAVKQGDLAAVRSELERAVATYPHLVSVSASDAEGTELGRADRGRPVDEVVEHSLRVVRSLDDAGEEEEGPKLVAVFATDRRRFDELTKMSQFVEMYKHVEQRRLADEAGYVRAFAALLGITILAAIGVGALLARGVSARIGELAGAMGRAGAGDLAIRVAPRGNDEITDLARGFNRMLSEIESSRARIEYLQRIEAWQEMARRLAHEIKNPLTPIQLAMQDIHRRYPGGDGEYAKLLDTALEIVEDEVGTLRRLVTEFSDFARLPQAKLVPGDLMAFLREQSERAVLLAAEREQVEGHELPQQHPAHVRVEFELPEWPAPIYFDRQMLSRALSNLVRNAVQAVEAARSSDGLIRVSLDREGDYYVVDVDDNGPGIPDDLRVSVFDPYVTTKTEGTGLGLAIVKKIVVEHGGLIEASRGPLGGARVRMSLPALGTTAAEALRARDWQSPSSSRRAASKELLGAPDNTA